MKKNKLITSLIALVLILSGAGAGRAMISREAAPAPQTVVQAEAEPAPEATTEEVKVEEPAPEVTTEEVKAEEPAPEATTEEVKAEEPAPEEMPEENTPGETPEEATGKEPENESSGLIKGGHYDNKEDVSLYLYTFGELPENYITKKRAKKLGWEGGGLEDYVKDGCIGGDYFGNYEEKLPKAKGRRYLECDIDTMGKNKRGAKRLIYSSDGLIYYTEDHYETFTLLYDDAWINLGER